MGETTMLAGNYSGFSKDEKECLHYGILEKSQKSLPSESKDDLD